jgi:hypothetical protein
MWEYRDLSGASGSVPESKTRSSGVLSDDILDRLSDLHKRATVERSYYVGRCVTDAINEKTRLRRMVRELH